MLKPETTLTDDEVLKVLGAIHGLRFGSIEITVHEGRIVQVERREKIRLDKGRRDLHPPKDTIEPDTKR